MHTRFSKDFFIPQDLFLGGEFRHDIEFSRTIRIRLATFDGHNIPVVRFTGECTAEIILSGTEIYEVGNGGGVGLRILLAEMVEVEGEEADFVHFLHRHPDGDVTGEFLLLEGAIAGTVRSRGFAIQEMCAD